MKGTPQERAIEAPIRGVVYRSYYQAAKALGVTPQAISAAARDGRLDEVGLGRLGRPTLAMMASRDA